jgi:hypothetical protein
MIETVLLAIIVAKLRGVRLKDIFRCWEFYPVFVCAIVYIFLQVGIFEQDYSVLVYANIYKLIYSMSLFFLIYKYKIYKKGLIGVGIIITGMALNELVKYANNGKMPVFPTLSVFTGYIKPDQLNSIDGWHILGSSATRLKFLSDIFDTGYCVMSIGDVLVRTFVFIVLYYSFKSEQKTRTSV